MASNKSQLEPCMVAVTILLSKYAILYGNVMQLVVIIQSVARRWTANNSYLTVNWGA